MKPFFYSILFVLLLPLGAAYSQQHIFVPGGHEAITLFSVDLSTCTSHAIDTLPLGLGTIACTPDGRLWGVYNDAADGILYQIDTSTGSVTNMGHFDYHGLYIDALAALNDSTLLFAGENVPASLQHLYALVTTPNNVHSYDIGYTGYTCWGDLVWYRDELYMTGFPGNSSDSMFLLKITFNNGNYPPIAAVTRVCQLPEVFSYTLGLATAMLPNADTAMIVFADSSNSIVNPSGNGLMIKLYPNPAKDALYIQSPYARTEFVCTDITGRVLKQQTINAGISQIEIGGLVAGMYSITIQIAGKGTYHQKIIKQ